MTRLHFVYSSGPHLKTPQRITHELAKRLARRFDLAVHDPASGGTIRPAPGDILIGHPDRYGESSIFNRAFREAGWSKRIVFCPFSHGMPLDAAAIDPIVEQADQFLALCGPHWFDTMEQSLFSHWRYKTMRCDLGVDLDDYPQAKTRFNPPGQRRFVYIGNAGPMKGVDFLCDLADANPNLSFHWIGATGDAMRPSGTLRRDYRRLERRLLAGRFTKQGWADWSNPLCRQIVAQFDFLLTCGRSDSNPTTILEASAWGLVPIATAQCGYRDDWIVRIPLDDVVSASRILQDLNKCPEAELTERRDRALARLRTDYTWDRVATQVADCIEAPVPAPPTDEDWQRRKARNQAALRAIVRAYKRQQAIEDRWHATTSLLRTARKLSARLAFGQG